MAEQAGDELQGDGGGQGERLEFAESGRSGEAQG